MVMLQTFKLSNNVTKLNNYQLFVEKILMDLIVVAIYSVTNIVMAK